MSNKILIPIGLLLAVILVVGIVVYNNNASKCQANLSQGDISAQDAGARVLNFVNNNILRGSSTASLVNTVEENGIYKVMFQVEGQNAEWRVSRDGKFVFPQAIDLTQAEEPAQEAGTTIGSFSVSANEACLENGKPIIYFFGSESCPHCKWEKPVMEGVMSKFEGLVSFHENIDSEKDSDVFSKYSSGGVPTIVMGCKYYRVGSGESAGVDEEANILTAITCKLTNGQPGNVCSAVQNLIDQIK